MKKMLFALMLFVFSFFTISTTQAGQSRAENAKTTIAKAKFSGHWEYWCVYNEKTGEFEIIAVWVEDDWM